MSLLERLPKIFHAPDNSGGGFPPNQWNNQYSQGDDDDYNVNDSDPSREAHGYGEDQQSADPYAPPPNDYGDSSYGGDPYPPAPPAPQGDYANPPSKEGFGPGQYDVDDGNQASAPEFQGQQLSISALQNQGNDDPGASPADEFAPPPPADSQAPQQYNQPSIGDYQKPEEDMPQDFGGMPAVPAKPNYADEQFGESHLSGGGAVDADGKPKYVPELNLRQVDPGSLGRRVAAGAWLFFSFLILLSIFQTNQVSIGIASTSPLILTGLLLITGARWAGILGIIMSVLISVFYIFIGLLVIGFDVLTSFGGVSMLPTSVGYSLIAMGVCFFFGNLLMLVKAPELGRSLFGALLVVVPLVATVAVAQLSIEAFVPKLTNPIDGFDSKEYGSSYENFYVVKPESWGAFEWAEIEIFSPLATDLTTKPNYNFLNQRQDALLSIYLTEPPKNTLATMLGQEILSPIEEEIIRGLPKKNREPVTYTYQGYEFQENVYGGTLDRGVSLKITIAHAVVGDKLFVIALTQRANEDGVTSSDSDPIFNEYFQSLRFD